MTRRQVKLDTRTEATCMECHQPMSYDVGYRSMSWYAGMVGTRAVLCSPECVTAFDAGNIGKAAALRVLLEVSP